MQRCWTPPQHWRAPVRTGEMSLSEFCANVEERKHQYRQQNGINPTSVSMAQDAYLKLCAASGVMVKSLHDMQIVVHWGRSKCSKG